MQYDAKTPSEYIKMLDDDWRLEIIKRLRKLIKKKAPKLKEGINYKMLSYSDKQGTVFHLNAQKNYVSLYVGNTKKIDPKGELLKGLNLGKGCIRLTKSVSIADTQLDKFIEQALKFRKQGKDIGC